MVEGLTWDPLNMKNRPRLLGFVQFVVLIELEALTVLVALVAAQVEVEP